MLQSDSNSLQLTVYPEGTNFQIVALHFEAEVTGGELALSNETVDFRYCSLQEIEGLDMFGRHKERIIDTLEHRLEAFIK